MINVKAIVYDRYGSPDVLRNEEVETPAPGDRDVLVHVHATSVTPTDAIFRSGRVVSARMFTGPLRPRRRTLGGEISGQVVAVGKGVTKFKVGDRVFADTGSALGAHAEYVRISEDGALAIAPAGLDHRETVAVLDGMLTALPFLRDGARLREGQEILINGASGTVGAAAVQLAKHHVGARVTGVCSTAKREMVESLGADEVIDYAKADFTRGGRTYDVIFDAAGKSSFSRCRRALRPGGIYLTTTPSLTIFLRSLWTRGFGGKRAAIMFTGLRPDGDKATDLRLLAELAEAKTIRPVIDGVYPLAEAAEAHRRVDSGRKQGCVLLTTEQNGVPDPTAEGH
ncbi:NAD(P)-dependent alcohol dehydrogenase [Thermopolyspora sp. NPDC052614]|uniref:NAD(P)-dependent alcohol dehydrogenase n=1 Tax=Thermopolyspora sp. NPDC052614 TaxID=3155682 RepID=UPI003441CDF7